jgi:3-oxoacyl-[acyl-carrier-protein] synthase-3
MPSILGFSAHLPQRRVGNEELAAALGVDSGWIEHACGIRERRYAARDETVVDLAEQAARKCMETTGMDVGDLGAILVGSGTPHRVFPGVSASLQQRLGNTRAFAFDIHLSSIGGLAALAVACDLCARMGPILVVAAEKMSERMRREPRKETSIRFGDGAGACLVLPGDGPVQVKDWRMGGDGSHADDLHMDWDGPLVMHGEAVTRHAIRDLQSTVAGLCQGLDWPLETVDLFLFHQANLKLLKHVTRGLGIPEARLFTNIQSRGNTSAASLLIAAAEAHDAGLMGPGRRLVMAAFGAGFTHGSMALQT